MDRRTFLAASATLPMALAQSPPKTWRVAVIGHTKRGDYGHSLDTLWARRPETELVAVADADEAGLAKAKERLNLQAGFTDYRKMLEAVKPDLVAVAPRHVDQHAEMILAATAAGARGIYVEKPYCRSPQEADAIREALEKTKTKLAVAHRNRYHPVLPVVKKLIADGTIGTVLEYRGRGKEDHRGGALDLWVLGTHVHNLACYFAGAPVSCSATLLQGDRPAMNSDIVAGAEGVGPIAGDGVQARFEMPGGVPYYFNSKIKAGIPAANFGLQIIGNRGIIDLRVDVEPLAHLLAGNPFQPMMTPRTWQPISTAGIGKPEPIDKLGIEVSSHSLAALDLIAAIREDRAPLCDHREAGLTIEMVNAVFASHLQNASRVPLPLVSRSNPLLLK